MKKKNKLLIFNQHASYITIDIANAFCKLGKYCEVILMAGVVNVREEQLDPQIRVVKTLPYNKNNIFTRFGSWIFAFLHLIILLSFKFRKHRLLLVSNPPLISFITWFTSRQYDALIFDVYPDALFSSGFTGKKNLIYRIWQKANLRFYKNAGHVYTISNGMKQSISGYCMPEKIEVVSLWSSFSPLTIPREENVFLDQFKLHGKFIVMYSGNMGKGLGLEVMIDIAEQLQEEKDILFMFIGEGWIMPDLQKKVSDLALNNCMFLPYQDASVLKHSLSAADLSLVALPQANGAISIPNKTYTLLALGRPLLCLSGADSDLSQLVKAHDIGEVFDGNAPEKIGSFILQAKNNPSFRNKLNQNAIQCSALFTKANAELFVN